MELTVIGAGTLAPHPERSPAGYHLAFAGTSLLVDCGSGTYHRAHRFGVAPDAVEAILLTHHHPDHTLDLAQILFSLRYVPPLRTAPLEVVGGPGTRAFVERLFDLYGNWIRPETFSLRVTEVAPGDRIERAAWTATVHAVRHDASSVAYRIVTRTSRGARVVGFTGDTGPCQGAVDACQAADLAVVECSNPKGYEVEGHLTAEEAGALAAAAGARRLLLTHRYPTCDDRDVLEEARANFSGEKLRFFVRNGSGRTQGRFGHGDVAPLPGGYPGEILLARDGMKIAV